MRPRPPLLLALALLAVTAPAPSSGDPAPGPLLVVAAASNPFGRYLAEILLAEGLGPVPVADLAELSPGLLASREIVVLGQAPLTGVQAQVLHDWVLAGGKLVAMRPDPRLAGLLGLAARGAVLSNADLAVDTTTAVGAGITGASLQFHGDADLYDLAGASAVAWLWSDDATPTSSPAVSRHAVGGSGGEAVAFTYDLARSVVYTRQGNPAWIWMERDGIGPLRPDDLFFGPSLLNPQPNWVDFERIAIPQADEQQRLLVNLILSLMDDRTPLPRFWYFPRGLSAVLVMTGDDHANGGTVGRFAQYRAASPPGCSVPDWQCVRSTSYIYPGTPIDESQAEQALGDGFEIGLHVNTHATTVTGPILDSLWTSQWTALSLQLPGVPLPVTNRNHTVSWSGWVTTAQVEREHGVRLDTNYYYWPPQWVQNRPGMFTGSGIPMRFADLDGALVDVYQLPTQMTDESGQAYPYTIHALLDGALGPNGYVGAFCANMHTDFNPWPPSDAIVAECFARGVPMISSKQMLDWLDGRNGSACALQSWSGDSLQFQLDAAEGARGLTALLPLEHHGSALRVLRRDGVPLEWTVRTVKGVAYVFFAAESGTHLAIWGPKGAALEISALTSIEGPDQLLHMDWTTSAAGDGGVEYGWSPTALTGSASAAAFGTQHAFALPPPAPGATLWYRVRSSDPFGTIAFSPPSGAPPATFVSPRDACASDRSAAGFGLADSLEDTWVTHDEPGSVVLRPALGAEFSGSELPDGWTVSAAPGGSGALSGGALVLSAATVSAAPRSAPGHTLDLEAEFAASPGQRAGLASEHGFVGLATDSTGGALQVRVESGSQAVEIPIAGSWLGAVHRYQVEWESDSTRVSIDDRPVAACATAFEESLQVEASDAGAGAPLRVLWMRLSPYADRGVFVSRVLDAGVPGALTITWASDIVDPASIGLETRTGATPVPDASWSAFQSLAGTSAGLGPCPRYLQYRATLTTTDPGTTPALRAVALSCETVAGVTAGAAVTRLLPPRPNPMTRGTRVTWDTGADRAGARLRIRVFDVAGRCVRTLFDAPSAAGPHQATWDGCDDHGSRLRPGIFRIRLEARGLDRTAPVVLLR